MPKEIEYIKVEKSTGDVLEEGTEKVYTIQEVNDMAFTRKYRKKKSEFESYIEGLGSYFFLFYNYLNKLDIPNEIKTRFIFLTTYSRFDDDGVLVDTEVRTQIQPYLTRQDLKNILNLKEDAFIRTMNVLKECNLIAEEKDKYRLNNNVVIRGILSKKQKKDEYTRIFTESVRDLYNNSSPRQHAKIYYLFAVLPLVNYKHNYICKNKKETDISKIEPIDIREVCEYIGYKQKDWKKFWNSLRYLKVKGENVISSTIVDRYIYIRVNPNLYYAGNQNCLDVLKSTLLEFHRSNYKETFENKGLSV